MNRTQTVFLVLLRVAFGALFLYSGFSKVSDPAWSAAGYLEHASSFSGLFHYLTSSPLIGAVNIANSWGQLFLGFSLILGLFTRLGSVLGAVLMMLYYLPILQFPYVGSHYLIVDEHIIFALSMLMLAAFSAGQFYGLDAWLGRTLVYRQRTFLKQILG